MPVPAAPTRAEQLASQASPPACPVTTSTPVPAADSDVARPAVDDAETTSSDQEHFQRGLGAYPLRGRHPTALLVTRRA
eukprot:5084887-Pleurochrysis_carterae.AAC.1